jgi:hypothetical protein
MPSVERRRSSRPLACSSEVCMTGRIVFDNNVQEELTVQSCDTRPSCVCSKD